MTTIYTSPDNNYVYTTETVDRNRVRPGDTIIYEGKLKTVGSNDIQNDSFMGQSVFGETYPRQVERVLFVTK